MAKPAHIVIKPRPWGTADMLLVAGREGKGRTICKWEFLPGSKSAEVAEDLVRAEAAWRGYEVAEDTLT